MRRPFHRGRIAEGRWIVKEIIPNDISQSKRLVIKMMKPNLIMLRFLLTETGIQVSEKLEPNFENALFELLLCNIKQQEVIREVIQAIKNPNLPGIDLEQQSDALTLAQGHLFKAIKHVVPEFKGEDGVGGAKDE